MGDAESLRQEQRYTMFELARRRKQPGPIGQFLSRPCDVGVAIGRDEFVEDESRWSARLIKVRSALNRATRNGSRNVATASDGTFLYVWNETP